MAMNREELYQELEMPTKLESAAVSMELDSIEQQEMNSFAEEISETELAEQQEMDAFAETLSAAETAEQQEMDAFAEEMDKQETGENVRLGYSSKYYEHQMAAALKEGNEIAYKNAKNNWAKAKVKEST